MPIRKTPQSRTNRTDPLENPYIARKLAKLQSNLMDRLHIESLEAQGKQRERVRVTARKPGPRTEEEKRKFYRARRMRPKQMSQPEFFTLDQAAVKLGYESEKSVMRLINSGKLKAEFRVHGGKRRWMIHRAAITSHSQIDRFKMLVSKSPIMNSDLESFGVVFVYGPWKETASARLPSIPRFLRSSFTTALLALAFLNEGPKKD